MFAFSFAAGTTDGPGEFDFTQGANTTNPFWDFVSGLLKDPSPEQEACHAPKPILLDTGEVSTVHIVFLKAPRYVNSQNSAISLKHNHSIDEIKLILYLQVRNSITHLTMTYSPKDYTPGSCKTLLLDLGKSLVIQISLYLNCVVYIWLKEDSFTYTLLVKQGVGLDCFET